MQLSAEDQEARVRAAVYDGTLSTGVPPSVQELAQSVALPRDAVAAALERLAAAHALVLQRDSREVLMAAPFSAVPTPFAVRVGERLYYANCIWDALGIPAMLSSDASIQASCGCCGESMRLSVEAHALKPLDGVVQFAIPAHRWWQDIVYT